MDTRFLVSGVVAVFLTAVAPGSAMAFQASPAPTPARVPLPGPPARHSARRPDPRWQGLALRARHRTGATDHRAARGARLRYRLSPARVRPPGRFVPPHLLRSARTWETRGWSRATRRLARLR